MRERLGRAFTLVELVIVIAIVGILAAIAIPRFIDIRSEAYISQRDGIVGSVRAGILTVASQNQVNQKGGTFPPNLEADWNTIGNGGALNADGVPCDTATPCFELVVPGGYVDTHWALTADAGLTNGKNTTKYDFTAPVGGGSKQYTYKQETGTFQ